MVFYIAELLFLFCDILDFIYFYMQVYVGKMDPTHPLLELIFDTGDLPEEAERLILHGANPNAIMDGDDDTILMVAIRNGRFEIARVLLRYGANVNTRNVLGETALHHAVRYGFVQELIEHGADLEAKDCSEMTPLHTSIWRGKLESTRTLLKAGANLYALDIYGRTPVQHARRNEVIQLCAEYAFDDIDIKEPG